MAPQYIASNSGQWEIFEAKIRRFAIQTCGSRSRNGTLYLLTGTSEYDMEGIIADNGNVNIFHSEVRLDEVKLAIPSALWTAVTNAVVRIRVLMAPRALSSARTPNTSLTVHVHQDMSGNFVRSEEHPVKSSF